MRKLLVVSVREVLVLAALMFALVATLTVLLVSLQDSKNPPAAAPKPVNSVKSVQNESICITNLAPKFWPDEEVRNAIPAWQAMLNTDFAKFWHTAHYTIKYMGRKPAPAGCISAVIQSKGPIDGALAYHWTERNNLPSITVYAGVGAFYGYSNSVSMTHELQEMAADPVTSYLNVGYPALAYWVETSDLKVEGFANSAIGWFSEVSDPVEADYYTRPGADGKPVRISDFVTPAWFNDGVGGKFDFMGLCQQPFWIRPGGYAQYLDATGWHIVLNFRKHHPSDKGFSLLDPRGGRELGDMAPIKPIKPKNPGMRPRPTPLQRKPPAKHPWDKGYKAVKTVARDAHKALDAINPF